MNTAKITLEQWQAFVAIAEHRSFSMAAEELNKSQSSISYAIQQLQAQLPVPVVEQQGRRTTLTEAGQTLLRHARRLVESAHKTEQLAQHMASGWETEFTLAVDVIFPPDLLFACLEQFSQKKCGARLQLLETVLSGTDESLLNREADIALSGSVPPGFISTPILSIDFLAVTAAHHPLQQSNDPITYAELANHRQIVIRDSGRKANRDAGWLGAEERWTVSHIATSISMVKRGLGFAWLPQPHIQHALASGELRPLALDKGAKRPVIISLVYANADHHGPAVSLFADILKQQSQQYSFGE